MALAKFDLDGFTSDVEEHTQISVRIDAATRNGLKRAAKAKDVSVGAILRAALEAVASRIRISVMDTVGAMCGGEKETFFVGYFNPKLTGERIACRDGLFDREDGVSAAAGLLWEGARVVPSRPIPWQRCCRTPCLLTAAIGDRFGRFRLVGCQPDAVVDW